MMKRLAIAGLAGAVVLFIWSSISWTLIPWHTMDKFPGEEGIRQTFKLTKAQRGVYLIPGEDRSIDKSALTGAELDAMKEARKRAEKDGPIALVVYDPKGGSPQGFGTIVIGFFLNFMVATTAAVLLMLAAPALPGLPGRVIFVVLLGVYTAIGTHLMSWNWLNYPLKFSLEMAGDTLLASLLLGVTLGLLVKPGMQDSGDDIDYETPAGE